MPTLLVILIVKTLVEYLLSNVVYFIKMEREKAVFPLKNAFRFAQEKHNADKRFSFYQSQKEKHAPEVHEFNRRQNNLYSQERLEDNYRNRKTFNKSHHEELVEDKVDNARDNLSVQEKMYSAKREFNNSHAVDRAKDNLVVKEIMQPYNRAFNKMHAQERIEDNFEAQKEGYLERQRWSFEQQKVMYPEKYTHGMLERRRINQSFSKGRVPDIDTGWGKKVEADVVSDSKSLKSGDEDEE